MAKCVEYSIYYYIYISVWNSVAFSNRFHQVDSIGKKFMSVLTVL